METCNPKYKIMSIEEKQQASLGALRNVRDFCDANGIRYYLAYGTLLGAIRHKGFIPWDDDIDLWIPRPDYERLLSGYSSESGQFVLYSCFNEKKYILPYAKIENLSTARLNPDGSIDAGGIGIDLFPLDGLPEKLAFAEKAFYKQNRKFLKIINRFYAYSMLKANSTANTVKLLAGKCGMKTGIVNRIAREIAKKMYVENYDDCTAVACVTGIHSGRFIPFKMEWFKSIKMDFEGESFNCPCGYHEILETIYGDYMVIPPVENRASTHTEKFVWRYE